MPRKLPDNDTIEVSVFGPGFGECIALHYGEGNWIVVDSCIDKQEHRPSALVYFENIDLDPAEHVTHFVLTHPDNDHISGAAELFRQCSSAKLVLPSVFSEPEMVSYAAHFCRDDTSNLTTATSEYVEILNILEARKITPLYVKQDSPLIVGDLVSLFALSPSDKKLHKFLTFVSMLIPKDRDPLRLPASLSHNAVSAVLLLQMCKESVILGADLEENPGKGWSTILTDSLCFESSSPTSLIKVPHHGSKNADNTDIWTTFCKNPYAVLTPFNRGRTRLPRPKDVARICARTPNSFSTSTYKNMRPPKDRSLEKLLKTFGIEQQRSEPQTGQVRLRKRMAAPIGAWSVELFKGAEHLSGVYA